VRAGALTFLFTDIEASTRRWEADAAAMSAALARHDEALRAAVTDAGGTVFKHTGDGICAVFGSAAAGMAAAVSGQQRLAGGPLRVRMGIHTGDVEERGGDYFGPTLNRVARLMAAAWGGQTLVSAAAVELAGDALPPGTALLDLGVHRLADLSRPDRIFQLSSEGLETTFPPLRTFSARRDNLPVTLTRFVGREAELAEIADLLKASRLVTVAGVGGAGKTRLATEVARRLVEQFPDGAFLVELASITDPQLVPATVAAALGLILDHPTPLPVQLADYLERRTTLLVLDNCEHVIEAAASLGATVLGRAPDVVVLATSREPLGIPGETVWRIPPLGAGDALDLVCDRARTADPGFSVGVADMRALERICTRLDGLPLALELAAARLHLLAPTEVAARLDDRFRLLTGGARTAVDRHRTLRATIDWGYDLLDEPSRALLRRLSVFAGGFDLIAAEAVGGPEAFDLLAGLVDRSWVAVEPVGAGPTRYRLIETIRQYAAEKLAEAGEAADARRAHCRHFRQLAESRGDIPGLRLEWLGRARLEEDNLRVALAWASGQGDRETCLELAAAAISHFAFNGRGVEGRHWLERALAIDPPDRSERTLVAMWLLGAYFPLAAESEAGETVLQQAAELARRWGPAALAADIRTSLARQLASRDPDRALALLTSDVATEGPLVDRDADDRHAGTAWGAFNRGWVRLAVGDAESAEEWFSQALELTEPTAGLDLGGQEATLSGWGGQVIGHIHAAAALAPLLAARGKTERASALAEEAVERARPLDLPIVLVMTLTRAAEVAVLLGRPADAAQRLAESVRTLRDLGTRAWVGDSLKLAAVVAVQRGEFAAAARLLGAAQAVDATTGDTQRPLAPGADLAASRASRALGEERFAAEHSAGEHLTIDAALTLALTTALGSGAA
jgi:predicted ATPase/class 3 adenylate cyclase